MTESVAPRLALDPPVAACLALIAERGWSGFALSDVARASGLGLADLFRQYQSRLSLLQAWLAAIDDAVLRGAASAADDTVRDRLFDTMMRRFDLLVPYREALRRLQHDLRRDPLTALALLPSIDRSMSAVLESAGLASDGLGGRLQVKALILIETRVVAIFCDDVSADLSKTMVALDRHLKTAERRITGLQRFCRGTARRPTDEAAPSAPA